MARKKVKLAFVVNDAARKASYKKRKKSLLKKIEELTILCGIEACAIIYSDIDYQQPEIWPSLWGVQSVLSKFERFSQVEQSKKMLNQETYMKQRLNKAKEQLEMVRKDNREKEMSLLMYQCLTEGKIWDNLSMVDLNDLAWLISVKQSEINDRLSTLNKNLASTSKTQPTKQEVEERQMVVVADEVTKQGQDRGKGVLETNMDDTQGISWFLNLIDGEGDKNQLLSFEGFNYLHK